MWAVFFNDPGRRGTVAQDSHAAAGAPAMATDPPVPAGGILGHRDGRGGGSHWLPGGKSGRVKIIIWGNMKMI